MLDVLYLECLILRYTNNEEPNFTVTALNIIYTILKQGIIFLTPE